MPKFSFVFLTDTHIQPELDAVEGVRRAVAAVRALPEKPDFLLIGGDLVMDAALVDRRRAEMVFDLWADAMAPVSIPVHYTIGNHDLFAIGGANRQTAQNPDYGKGLWLRRLKVASRFGRFDHKGWRFVRLDSCGITPDGGWEGKLDDDQLRWLDDLLRQTPRDMPLAFLTHFPLVTAYTQFTEGATKPTSPGMIVQNAKTFLEMTQKHSVRAVFQGHTHIVEEIAYNGARYITGGAVCGDWWKGPRLGIHPEGFLICTVDGPSITTRYKSYGWKARA